MDPIKNSERIYRDMERMGLASIAQQVERLFCNQRVGGSIPPGCSKNTGEWRNVYATGKEAPGQLALQVQILPPQPNISACSSMDRASDFYSDCCGFNSYRAYQIFQGGLTGKAAGC